MEFPMRGRPSPSGSRGLTLSDDKRFTDREGSPASRQRAHGAALRRQHASNSVAADREVVPLFRDGVFLSELLPQGCEDPAERRSTWSQRMSYLVPHLGVHAVSQSSERDELTFRGHL
jgi:hypothetical protein